MIEQRTINLEGITLERALWFVLYRANRRARDQVTHLAGTRDRSQNLCRT